MKQLLLIFSLLMTTMAMGQVPSTLPVVKGMVWVGQASPPDNPKLYEQYRDSDDGVLYEWNGTSWNAAYGTGGVMSVNGYIGTVEIDADDLSEGTTNKFLTAVERANIAANTAKVGYPGAPTAAEVAFAPNGSISATDVQAAIQELRDEVSSTPTGTENNNPELLIDWGSTSYPPNESYTLYWNTDYPPMNNVVVEAVYDDTNGVGNVVTQVTGTGTNNPIFRIFFETEHAKTYDINIRYRTLTPNTGGRIAVLGGAASNTIQIPNNSLEWQTFHLELTDNNQAFNGIVVAVQGYQPTSRFQFKASQKEKTQ